MTLRVIGAGVGRTGTNSLQVALEKLLGGPCYHMVEVFKHPEHVPLWHAALRGEGLDAEALMGDYVAEVDFPSSLFWRELMDENPDAIVLLSERDDAEAWWRSADRTIFGAMRRPAPPPMADWAAMVKTMVERFGMPDFDDADAAKAAYERHNAAVRAGVPAERLVCWKPGDGWEPICAALGIPVPDEPFPHLNTTDDFRAMAGLDADGAVSEQPYYPPPAGPPPGWVVSPSDGWSAPKGMTPDGRRLAGPGKRLLGLLLDGLVVGVPAIVLYGLLFVVLFSAAPSSEGDDPGAGFFIGLFGIYGLIFLLMIGAVALEAEMIFRRGSTLGMGWAGLRVIDLRTGGPVSRGRAWGRTLFARFISGQICGLGFWWALFDDRNRTLHDLVVGTVVVEA